MDTTRIAQPEQRTTRERRTSRSLRGFALYREHANEIRFEHGTWLIPSQSDLTSVYEVVLGRRGESCECRDFEFRGGPCLHIYAATLARAKSTTCACCLTRVPWRLVTEVQEEDELLSFFPGDRLCVDCVWGGYWA